MNEARGERLLKGTLIYAVGNLGSKLLMVLMLPMYAHFLPKEDFGYYDLSMNILFLVVSSMSFNLKDGVFRFLLNTNNEKEQQVITSSAASILLRNCCVLSIITIPVYFLFPFKCYPLLLVTMNVFCIYEVVVQSLRGISKTKVFVEVNLLVAFFTCLICFVLIKTTSLRLEAFYLGIIGSRLLGIVFSEWKVCFFRKYISKNFVDKQVKENLIKYTIPLVPNVICLWAISSSCRLFVAHFLDLSSSGILAVSLKFSEILYMVSAIFYQSWQETAIKEYNSTDKDFFFSKIFNKYFCILTTLAITGSFFIKAFFPYIIGNEYKESLDYIYLLMIAMIFTAMSFFLDLGYQCSLQSHKALPSIVSASLINITLNYIFISKYGLYGGVAVYILTYAYLFVYRVIDTRRYFRIKFTPVFYIFSVALLAFFFIYKSIESIEGLAAVGSIGLIVLGLLSGKDLLSFAKKNRLR
ncbi:MAG: polysaccharide biosynthesis C-terminal domain-containing protein [Dysgonamonadaceae bacterium]